MLEEFIVFSRSGFVIFSWFSRNRRLTASVVSSSVIDSIFLTGSETHTPTTYCVDGKTPVYVDWEFDNELSLIFVVAFAHGERSRKTSQLTRLVQSKFLKYGVGDYTSPRYKILIESVTKILDEFADGHVGINSKHTHRSFNSPSDGEEASESTRSEEALQQTKLNSREDLHGDMNVHVAQPREAGQSKFSENMHRNIAEALPNTSNSTFMQQSIIQFRRENSQNWVKNVVSNSLSNFTGQRHLENDELEPILEKFKASMLNKNVACAVAEQICVETRGALLGTKVNMLSSISATIDATLRSSLRRMLSTENNIDVLTDVHAAKAKRYPYVIVFIGVNGVGKSTSLSKLAAWLLSNNLSVLVSACDTFRAGAVEQLRTHCQRLGVPLYERGYEKDPALIAQEAIVQAKRQGIDVVLIDTAGRMQDNQPLMRSLSKLIDLNNPDLVLFVGEALVGNEAVDQLRKFNQSLADFQFGGRTRVIDGILVSKFDTIDNKVGAILSMVRSSGSPILFVGCGQSYNDLQIPNMEHLIDLLLTA